MSTTFARLGVPNSICRALERAGIQQPFEIQAATIADALDGRDICGRAPTGSGKTLAFGIPLVANAGRAEAGRPRALVLSPTRELADQIASDLRTFAGDVRVGVVYGGVGYGPQLQRLRRGVDILVACPGRLEDLIGQDAVTLYDVDQVVIDEADRMADMGFLPAVRRLMDDTDPDRQTFLFSATLDGDVKALTRDYQHDPVTHSVGAETPDVAAADHRFWKVERAGRLAACVDAINAVGPTIVFCRTRHGSDRLARQLSQRGVSAAAIHGGHAQNRRTRSLRQFSDGAVQALVATDVAARGIHVDGVALVIHYDPPEDHKAYLHRSGRTARAGEGGLVVSLIQPEQTADTKRIQRRLGLEGRITEPQAGDLASQPVVNGARPGSGPTDRAAPAERNGHGDGNARPRHRSHGQNRGADRQGQPRPGNGRSNGGQRNRSRQRNRGGARPAANSRNRSR
jgi:superfamily II DNA/RNA helicase